MSYGDWREGKGVNQIVGHFRDHQAGSSCYAGATATGTWRSFLVHDRYFIYSDPKTHQRLPTEKKFMN